MGASGRSDSKDANKDQPQPVLNISGDVKGNIIVGDENGISGSGNAHSLKKQTDSQKGYGCQFNVFITIAMVVIGCVGIVGLVAINGREPFSVWLFGRDIPSSLPSTSTPVTEVFTPAPPVSSPTETPVMLPGSDWTKNCIYRDVWTSYLAGTSVSTQSECYQLDGWGIAADNGRLVFASHQSQSKGVEYGLFSKWNHEWRQVGFSVEVDRQQDSEIWFGLFEGETLNSRGVVFVIQPGDVVDVREMPSGTPLVDNIELKFAEGKFHPCITLDGGKFAVVVDGQGIISKWPLNFVIQNMFVGFRSLPNTNLNAAVFDLRFAP